MDSRNAFDSTPETWREAARIINAIGGGDENHPSPVGLDFAPETLRYVAGELTGGIGRTMERLGRIAASPWLDEPPDSLDDIPVLRRFVMQVPDRGERTRRYESLAREAATAEMRFKAADPAGKAELRAENADRLGAFRAVEAGEKALRKIRERLKQAKALGASQEELRKIRDQMDATRAKALKASKPQP